MNPIRNSGKIRSKHLAMAAGMRTWSKSIHKVMESCHIFPTAAQAVVSTTLHLATTSSFLVGARHDLHFQHSQSTLYTDIASVPKGAATCHPRSLKPLVVILRVHHDHTCHGETLRLATLLSHGLVQKIGGNLDIHWFTTSFSHEHCHVCWANPRCPLAACSASLLCPHKFPQLKPIREILDARCH